MKNSQSDANSFSYEVFTERPKGFNPAVEAAGCYCYCQGKLLFLKRHPEKSQGNTWGVPGGKIEKTENPRMAVIREIHEEVGLNIDDDNLEIIGQIYCRLPHMDYVYYLFKRSFNDLPTINLALEEHIESRWVTIDEALALPLIAGGVEALNCYNQSMCI